MFKKILLIALVAVLAVGTSGCVIRRAESSERTVDTRDVGEFGSVDFEGFGDLTIVQGSAYEVELSGPADLVEKTSTEVHGSTLEIKRDARWEVWILGSGNRHVDVTITVPDELEELSVAGAGTVNIDGYEGKSFRFELSGAGSLEGEDVKLEDLVVDMSGAGQADLSGVVDEQEVTISGAGEYKAEDLESEITRIDMSGAGAATVWATKTLDIKASGAGDVKYWGDPDVTQEVSGAGSVKGLGDK